VKQLSAEVKKIEREERALDGGIKAGLRALGQAKWRALMAQCRAEGRIDEADGDAARSYYLYDCRALRAQEPGR
jgi:hypothetical protein